MCIRDRSSTTRPQKYLKQAQTSVETIVAVANVLDEELPAVEFYPDPDDNLISASVMAGGGRIG